MTDIKQPTIQRSKFIIGKPLSAIDSISSLIDGMLIEVHDQHQNLLETQQNSHSLDYKTLQRVIVLYSEELDFLQIYRQHFCLWNLEQPSPEQSLEITRLEQQIEHIEPLLHSILEIARNLKGNTIEGILDMKDSDSGTLLHRG